MKVFIADDSQVLRERLIEMLSELPDIEIMGFAQDVPEALPVRDHVEQVPHALDITPADLEAPGPLLVQPSLLEALHQPAGEPAGLVVFQAESVGEAAEHHRRLDVGLPDDRAPGGHLLVLWLLDVCGVGAIEVHHGAVEEPAAPARLPAHL